MGKSARNRLRRQTSGDIRSAYVATLREMEWSANLPSQHPEVIAPIRASLAALKNPDIRIVRFPASQADAFRGYGDDLSQAAQRARPPFEYTFYDFGFLKVGAYEIVGALVLGESVIQEPWLGVAYLRSCGTNDWSNALMSSTTVSSGSSTYGQIGPDEGRPPADDAALAAVLIICGALTFLESANVELIEANDPGTGHRASGIPHYNVIVRSRSKRYIYPEDHRQAQTEWSHRWEVRGHFKHFRNGPVFENNPHRRLGPSGDPFVRIWCPPHVKGPNDKPFIPKIREVSPR